MTAFQKCKKRSFTYRDGAAYPRGRVVGGGWRKARRDCDPRDLAWAGSLAQRPGFRPGNLGRFSSLPMCDWLAETAKGGMLAPKEAGEKRRGGGPEAPASSPTNGHATSACDGVVLDQAFETYAARFKWSGWQSVGGNECAEEDSFVEQPGSMILDEDSNRVLRAPNHSMRAKSQVELNRMLCKIASKPLKFIQLIKQKRSEDGFFDVGQDHQEDAEEMREALNDYQVDSNEFLVCNNNNNQSELEQVYDEGDEEDDVNDGDEDSNIRGEEENLYAEEHSASAAEENVQSQGDEAELAGIDRRKRELCVQATGLRDCTDSPLPAIDTTKLHQYSAKSVAGRGSFSIVYRATRRPVDSCPASPQLGKPGLADVQSENQLQQICEKKRDTTNDNSTDIVALKCVNLDRLDSDVARKKCIKEIKALQTLQHPNIICCLDTFRASSGLFIVLEWAAAGDLKRLLNRVKAQHSRLHEKIIWTYFVQVSRAVAYMHSMRTLHRDIKAANIFIMSDGRIKLGDLGLTRALSNQTLRAYSKVGTPLYMAPEVLRGAGHDFKSDVWATGCVLYELAMLHSPFEKDCKTMRALFARILAGDYSSLSEDQAFSKGLTSLIADIFAVDACDRPDADQVVALAEQELARY